MNATFEHIHQIIKPIPEVKNSALINGNEENIIAFWEESKQSEV